MKKVVETINNGQLDRNFGTLTFSVSSIEHTICMGENCEGSFTVFAAGKGLAEGTVMSDDYRMECIGTSFSGAQDEIAYRFHAEELSEGDSIHGNFVILSNRGEYTIPFDIHIEAAVLDSSLGPIRNVFHFANLAKSNWDEAVKIFYDPGFIQIFRESDRDYLPIYRCLSGVPGSAYNMDEFLISIHKKTPVEYISSVSSIEIEDPVGMSRFSFNISRNGWGYTSLAIETEGDFLDVDRRQVSQEDFMGNSYLAYYYVDTDKLHAGRNYGAIKLRDSRQTVNIPVVVRVASDEMGYRDITMNRMKSVIQVMEYYQAFRLKKISSRIWLTESNKLVEKMLANDPADLLARLYQIHVMVSQERFNEANWNLKSIRNAAQSVRDTKTYLWCYYLYLCSLSDAYADQLDENTAEVEACYKQNPGDWRIAWILSYMSDEYKNNIRRWVIYEEAFDQGCSSPVMYMEAARMVIDNPSLLTKLDNFEIQVLRYICKKGLMSSEIVFVLRSLAERLKEYSEPVTTLLKLCYKDLPHDELLTTICAQLIKGNCTDSSAFKWYSYAVKQNLKITRLYEYYMMSVDKSAQIKLPRTVLLYFSFHSDLDFETNAYLYSEVLENKENDPDMYSRYQTQIIDFVNAQLIAGHNNGYLSKLYRAVINEQMITDDSLSPHIADIFFIHEVDVSEYPEARSIVLCYGHRGGEQVYPVTSDKAEIPIFSEDYCIALEDSAHRRYVSSKPVMARQLMPPGRLQLQLQLMLRNHLGMDVHCCMEHHMTFDIRMENEFRFRNLLEKKYFSEEYSRNITMKLVRFYYERDKYNELDAFLEELEPGDVASFERAECVGYMIRRNKYAKAMNWIYRFGPEGVDRSILADLVYGWVPTHIDDVGIYKNLVTQLILMTLQTSSSSAAVMTYLTGTVCGTLKTLRDARNAAREASVSCRDLEERILIQLMYTGAYLSDRSEILKEYALDHPDADVLTAALASISYEYFVMNGIVTDDFFFVLTEAMETEIELHIICSLAYVKHFAENKDLIDEKIRPILKDALHNLLIEGMVLECFKKLADFMPSMAQYADSAIIEYRTEPGAKVRIHYIIESDADGDYVEEDMNEIYGGVYSKVFTLFFGEKLQYYITEDNELDAGVLTQSSTLMRNDIDESTSEGRFGVINDICVAKTLHDYATVDMMLEEYYLKDYMSGKLFGMHKG